MSEVEAADCDLAVLDEAAANGDLPAAVRSLMKTKRTVLILVRSPGLQGALNAITLGAAEILPVPFDPADLVIRASQAIHRVTGSLPELLPEVNVGTLRVNVTNGNIALNGRAPHLSPLEKSLLYLLVANTGRTVSRAEIIESVWGVRAEVHSNLVDRHIRDLRRKLHEDWRRPNVLATTRGSGYTVPITDWAERSGVKTTVD